MSKFIQDIKRAKNYFFPPNEVKNTGLRTDSNHNVNNLIARVRIERIRQDILTWRDSIREAEQMFYPHRVKMQRLFGDTVLNGHVKACIDSRKNMILQKKHGLFNSEGEESKYGDVLKSQWFNDVISGILDSELYAYTLLNWDAVRENKLINVRTIRRENVSPDRKNIAHYVYSLSGTEWDSEDWKDFTFYCQTQNEWGKAAAGYGLLYYVAYYEIMIRNNMGYNADFVEKFITPFVIGKTTKTEEEDRDELFRSLAALASSSAAVIDPTDEIEFMESKNTGTAYNSFDNLESRCMKMISKLLLGHADAIDSTTGKLGSVDESAKEAMQRVENAVAMYVQYIVNDQFIPKLREIGFVIPMGLTFAFKNDKEKQEEREAQDDLNKKTTDIVKTLYDSGFEVDEKYITERTGIPLKRSKDKPSDIISAANRLYV